MVYANPAMVAATISAAASQIHRLEPSMSESAELTARVERVIHASAARIRVALTTPACLKQFFFGADVVTDWKIGSPIRMKGEFNGKSYEDKGEIIANCVSVLAHLDGIFPAAASNGNRGHVRSPRAWRSQRVNAASSCALFIEERPFKPR